jgi:hypothetical protein
MAHLKPLMQHELALLENRSPPPPKKENWDHWAIDGQVMCFLWIQVTRMWSNAVHSKLNTWNLCCRAVLEGIVPEYILVYVLSVTTITYNWIFLTPHVFHFIHSARFNKNRRLKTVMFVVNNNATVMDTDLLYLLILNYSTWCILHMPIIACDKVHS